MTAVASFHNPLLGIDSWGIVEDADRRFRRVSSGVLIAFLLLAVGIALWHPDGLERGGGDTTERRYVSLLKDAEIADQVEDAKPAEEDSKKPAEEPKPKESPKQDKPKPTPKAEPSKEQIVENAREKAAQTGVMAMADQLKALRDNSLTGLDSSRPLSSDIVTAKAGTGASGGSAGGGAIASSAAASSGGISGTGTGEERRSQSGAGLGTRRTTTVESPIGLGPDKTKPGQNGNRAIAGRTLDEIQLTFDRNKAAFYSMYLRALRENSELRGKVVVSLTIAPDGSVTNCTLVSSELGNPDLESKIIQRVKLLNFGAKSVAQFTFPNYPIYFTPP